MVSRSAIVIRSDLLGELLEKIRVCARVDLAPEELAGGTNSDARHLAAQALLGVRRVELDLLLRGRQDACAFGARRALGLLDQLVGAVLRVITVAIPKFDDLKLPPVLKDVIMTKRGLVLFVGGTGSGKSTSLAAMIGYRNENSHGHIITIEDPVEYVHPHKNCLITQREVVQMSAR